jgi:HK97 family phage major capsid protein
MPKVSYHSNEDSARNAWTTLCAKNGMPEAINSGGSAASLKESEIHALRKTTRRALNTISDTMKPGDYNDAVTDALVYAGNTIESCNEALERIQDAERFFGKSEASRSKVLRNRSDFESHYKTGDQNSRDHDGMGIGDFFRGVGGMKSSPAVQNALSTGTSTAGGYLVPSILMPNILAAMTPVSSLLTAGAGIVILEEGGSAFTYAGVAAVPTASWRLEAGTLATSDTTFRAITATPKSLAFQFKISRELLADGQGIETALYQAIAQAFARELDRAALIGTGTNPEPRGLLNTVGVQAVTNGVNGLTLSNYANLFSGVQAILQADCPMPTAAIMAPRSLVKLGGLTSTTNEYIEPPIMLAGIKQIATSQIPTNLTVGTSSDCSLMFTGDFTNLLFCMREGISIQMLREAFAGTGEVGFACHVRADVVVPYPASFAIVSGIRA